MNLSWGWCHWSWRRPGRRSTFYVLGPVPHDGFVHSIYFFDPNGIRLELTLTVSSAQELQASKEEKHAACTACSAETSQCLATH